MKTHSVSIKDLYSQFNIPPGKKVKLSNYDPDYTAGLTDRDSANEILEDNIKKLSELQKLLYAENKNALLVVLQGMDTSGKDGTISHVMHGVNPQGCQVTSFKAPSEEELDHDFLWRIHKNIPNKGNIGIFNRSHYEDVLVVRVKDLVPRSVWKARYEQINKFEEILSDNDVKILKFFLHISKEEQKKRLEARLNDPTKNWKFSLSDIKERELWDKYTKAYEEMLSRCSTEYAPWFVIPANHKWFRNFAVSQIIVEELGSLKMKFPKSSLDLSKIKIR
ncbi:MAG: polyphosphate kinase 2 family protein [Candidatus Melainabacteria bacterium]|nr:polyphosphate kinase 2 family protein [Candidatus Melainabacteria bacterium]